MANMTKDELDLYDKAGIAIADARGRIELAREEGFQDGEKKRPPRRGCFHAASMLLKLMRRKFGQTPDWVATKVTSANLELIEVWGENVLFANSVDGVFAS